MPAGDQAKISPLCTTKDISSLVCPVIPLYAAAMPWGCGVECQVDHLRWLDRPILYFCSQWCRILRRPRGSFIWFFLSNMYLIVLLHSLNFGSLLYSLPMPHIISSRFRTENSTEPYKSMTDGPILNRSDMTHRSVYLSGEVRPLNTQRQTPLERAQSLLSPGRRPQ